MCRMHVVGAFIRLLLLVVSVALSLCMPNALIGIGVWGLIWLMWERLPPEHQRATPSVFDALVFLPYAIGAQVALDSLVPYLGDVSLVVTNVAIVAAVRRPKLPAATVVVRRR